MQSTVSLSAVDSVMHALMSVGRMIKQRGQGDELDPGTFWLLRTIRTAGSMRVTELAGSAGLDTSTVSRHVAQMERTGLLERTPDPDDGRAQRVTITAAGHEQLEAAIERRRRRIARSLAEWDETDINELERLLDKLVASIETDNESSQS